MAQATPRNKFSAGTVILLILGLILFSLARRSHHTGLRLPVGPVTPAVSLGERHGVILASNGSLWSWGSDYLGWPVLGLGNLTNETELHRIGHDTNWIGISAASDANLAVKSDGTLWGWGANYQGQLGGGTTRMQNQPVPSVPGNDWKQAATGGFWSLAVKTNGTLWAWGGNWCGQLGIGVKGRSFAPTQVGTATNWTRVWARDLQSVGQQSDGTLWFWGDNPEAHMGSNSFVLPRRLSPDTNWVDVSFGSYTAFCLKSDGTLWTWGRFAKVYAGQPGKDADAIPPPTATDTNLFSKFFDIHGSATPLRIGTNADWKALGGSGWWYQILLKRDGTLWVLDATEYNQIKLPSAYHPIALRQLNLPKDLAAFAVAGGHGVAPGVRAPLGVVLTREGEVWTWGMVLGESPTLLGSIQIFTARLVDLVHVKIHWNDPQPVIRETPWRLSHSEFDD